MAKSAATILLVEDDTHDVELMKLAFDHAKSPFSFVSVSDGGEAVKYLTGEGKYADRALFPEPWLVLLDLSMPVMDGFEVLRWMSQQTPSQWPPVIVLSYSRLENDVKLAVQLGAKLYVQKPIDLDAAVAFVKGLGDFHVETTTPSPTVQAQNLPDSGPRSQL